MRKFTFLAILLFSILKLHAQDYLITFEGTGATSQISTVIVKNLTQETSLTMQGNQVLHLKKVITSIESTYSDDANEIRFYPNPMNDYTFLEFNLPTEGTTQIEFSNLSGKKIIQTSTYLHSGLHTYQITGLTSGVYLAKISGANYLLSAKLLCNNNCIGSAQLTYLNTNSIPSKKYVLKSGTTEVEMQYNEGDLMEYIATDENYTTVIVDIPNENKNLTFTMVACADADGKSYSVIQMANQTWMAENLAYLPTVNPAIHGSFTAPFYYVYDYEGTDVVSAKMHSNYDTYGVLYNYTAAISACPTGWHLPTDDEWSELENYLIANGYNYDATTTENKIAKAIASTVLWMSPVGVEGSIGNNLSLNNRSGFSALPGGTRHDSGAFKHIGEIGTWWSFTERSTNFVWYRSLNYYGIDIFRADKNKAHGSSIRCIKD